MTLRGMPTNLEELQNRLREAEETLAAIRNGEVDSLIVSTNPLDPKVFSLTGAEQPYRIFVEKMQQGALTMTRGGAILYANLQMAELLKTPLEKIIGADITDFLEEAEHGRVLGAIGNPESQRIDFELCAGGVCAETSKRPTVPVSLALSPLPLEGTEGVCGVVTDLTEYEQKRELASALGRLTSAQEQLRKQNEELLSARKLAEQASDAKDEFLATLSHELRTPLTPVLMVAQALEHDSTVPSHVQSDLAMIRRNVELEARLIDDLLDLTRIVRGKVEFRMSDVSLSAVCDNVLEICEADLHAGEIRLKINLGALQGLRVRGDAVRIQQILWNLVRNAVKFTPAGGEVSVSAAEEGGKVVIEVTDTGIGMEPSTIARIFSPFEQAGREVTRRFGGLGLGLVISRKLAELHGGTITAASPGPGRGSTFLLQLPLAPTSIPAPKPVTSAPGAMSATKRLKILLVEDHDDTRKSMTRLLSMEHEVRPAHSVASALETAEAAPFDLLISDLGLPDGSGFELMKEIIRRHGSVKGICLSGYGMEHDIATSKAAGFLRHLTKPVSIATLKAAIAETAQ